MTPTSATRVLVLGAGLVLAGIVGLASALPRLEVGWVVLAAAGWWLALGVAARARISLAALVTLALVLRVPGLVLGPVLSDDVHRYAWEGEVVLRGASPYLHAPDAPELAELRAEEAGLHARVNHRDVPAAYPPLAQLVHAGLVGLARLAGADPVLLIRLAYVLCDLFVVVVLARLLARRGLPVALASAWALAPLAALEFSASGHLDALAILLLLVPWAHFEPATRRGALAGSVLLAAGALVKLLPVVALPPWWRDGRARALAVATVMAVLAAGFLPLALHAGSFAGLADYGERWEGMNLVHRWIAELARALAPGGWDAEDVRLAARAAGGLGWVALVAWAWRRRSDGLDVVRAAVAGFLLLTPVLHPWYVCWMLPFLALRLELAWAWLAGVAPLLYVTLERGRAAGDWSEPAWLWPVVALPFLVLLAARCARAWSRGVSSAGAGAAS
jgi:hypothetical protein